MLHSVGRIVLSLLMFAVLLQGFHAIPAFADEKAERIQSLQEKMARLKELLADMQEQELRKQPPGEIPWEPILQSGQERPAYGQYAYLLAPQLAKEHLDSILQQIYFLAEQDPLKERGNLFVIPALPLDQGEVFSVARYNRAFAGELLRELGIPTAVEGGLLLAPEPLAKEGTLSGPLLYIDLHGVGRILRTRIFELLQQQRLFVEDGSIQDFLWKLLNNAQPAVFMVHQEKNLTWLAVAPE